MGYRATVISQYKPGQLPDWFLSKYRGIVDNPYGVTISYRVESKFFLANLFFEDYQRAIRESGFWDDCASIITLVVLGEDGHITKVVVSEQSIEYFWMDGESEEMGCVWQLGI